MRLTPQCSVRSVTVILSSGFSAISSFSEATSARLVIWDIRANLLAVLPQDLNRLHGSLEQLTKQLTNAEEELKQPFLQEQELSDKSARLAELDALLNVGNDAPIIEGEAEELEEEPEDALIQSDDELER